MKKTKDPVLESEEGSCNADLQNKIDSAIEILRENEPKDEKGYALAFSGGKDSCVIKQLAIEAGG